MGSREKLHKPQPDLGSTVIWLVSCKLQVAPDTKEIRILVFYTTKWMNDGTAGALCQASHASSVMDNYNWQLMWEGGQEQADASPQNYPDHQHIPGVEHYPAINTHPEVRACHFSCHTSHYLNGVLSVSHSLLLQLLEGSLTVALMQLIDTMFCPTCSNWPFGSQNAENDTRSPLLWVVTSILLVAEGRLVSPGFCFLFSEDSGSKYGRPMHA